MNQTILKRLDAAITSTLIGHSEDPDCNVGASICILHRGEEVYRKEYGEADKEKHHPMKPDTIFRCYSMTKPITSVAVMTLVEKGALALSDPASKYLPGFKDQKVYTDQGLVPVNREVTIQDLLDMTAGVVYPDASFPAGAIMDKIQADFYDKIAKANRLLLPMNWQISSVNSLWHSSQASAGYTVFAQTFSAPSWKSYPANATLRI